VRTRNPILLTYRYGSSPLWSARLPERGGCLGHLRQIRYSQSRTPHHKGGTPAVAGTNWKAVFFA